MRDDVKNWRNLTLPVMKDSSFEIIRNKYVCQTIFRKPRRVFKKEMKSRYLDKEIDISNYLYIMVAI